MLKIAWDTSYTIPLPEGHRFPMIKYDLIPEQLMYEGTIKTENIFSPGVLPEEKLFGIHDQSYWYKLNHGNLTKEEIRNSPTTTDVIYTCPTFKMAFKASDSLQTQ